jgi:SAM-dependent methyltransferase
VDAAIAAGALHGGSAVLEIGCGTGKLSELLVERGLRVHSVEPGANLIEAARARLGPTEAVTFDVARFEDADLAEHSYDAVFSATAFHWIDPAVGWAKVASVLKPGGLLALIAYVGVEDARSAAIDAGFRELLRAHAPALSEEWHEPPGADALLDGAGERRGNASEVWDWVMSGGRHDLAIPEAAALFEDVATTAAVRRESHDAGQALALLRTTSFYAQIPESAREAFDRGYRRLIEADGGSYEFSLADVLMTARTPSG